MTQTYTYQYNTYPIHSEETSYEGAFKRFSEFPTPQSVYDYTLAGIPKVFPLTKEPIPLSFAQTALESAVAEIEMAMGMDLSEVVRYHSEDYVTDMFTANYAGIRLQHLPVTAITHVQLKFPHTNTQLKFHTLTIPASWVYLKKNRINIIAGQGVMTYNAPGVAPDTVAGIFGYMSGWARNKFQPGAIEVIYTSGWKQDQLPSNVADLIKTWAAYRWLPDLIPLLAPNTGVSVSIDGVQQSSSNNLAALLAQRYQTLEKKKEDLELSVMKHFGKTIKTTQFGA